MVGRYQADRPPRGEKEREGRVGKGMRKSGGGGKERKKEGCVSLKVASHRWRHRGLHSIANKITRRRGANERTYVVRTKAIGARH